MSDSVAEKLSREEIAKIEIGRTDVSRPVQYVLTGFFLLVHMLAQIVLHKLSAANPNQQVAHQQNCRGNELQNCQ